MSFTINKTAKSRPICKIQGGKYDGNTVFYVDDDDLNLSEKTDKKSFTSLKLTDGKFVPCCNPNTERQIISCLAPSGAGKTYIAKLYMQDYKKHFKQSPMYIISALDEDKTLDQDLPELNRIKLTDQFIKEPLEMKDFPHKCLVMLDDTDSLRNKDLKAQIDLLKDEILQCGRHRSITCILTSHQACNGKETKLLLNESHQIFVFMSSGANYQRLLQTYIGMSTQQIKKLKNFKSRYTCIVRGYPMILYTERQIMFLADL